MSSFTPESPGSFPLRSNSVTWDCRGFRAKARAAYPLPLIPQWASLKKIQTQVCESSQTKLSLSNFKNVVPIIEGYLCCISSRDAFAYFVLEAKSCQLDVLRRFVFYHLNLKDYKGSMRSIALHWEKNHQVWSPYHLTIVSDNVTMSVTLHFSFNAHEIVLTSRSVEWWLCVMQKM